MSGSPTSAHWDGAYGAGAADRPDVHTSWYEPTPQQSLAMLDQVGVTTDDSVIDVGGGTAPLTRALLERGHRDLSVLDVSATAIERARHRLGEPGRRVAWIQADLTGWRPERRYDVWHDRALFHFLIADEERSAYRRVLRQALAPRGTVVVATFAGSGGPTHCSGLPVARYDDADLAAALGLDPASTVHGRHDHTTPWDVVQPFTWVAGSLQ